MKESNLKVKTSDSANLTSSRQRSQSPNKSKALLNPKKTSTTFKWKTTKQELPSRRGGQELPVTKNNQDRKNYYKYKQNTDQLSLRSNISEISNFILGLINVSEQRELTNTQKFMLGGYIDVYIKQKSLQSDLKDNTSLNVKKLKIQWNRIANSWQLYKIKQQKCNIDQNQEKSEMITKRFEQLYQQMLKLENKSEKLEPIRKLLKKFELELIS